MERSSSVRARAPLALLVVLVLAGLGARWMLQERGATGDGNAPAQRIAPVQIQRSGSIDSAEPARRPLDLAGERTPVERTPVERATGEHATVEEAPRDQALGSPGVHGRVRGSGGPVRGARVSLHRAVTDPLLEVDGFPARSEPDRVSDAWTDALGRFHLRVDEPGRYFVRAQAAGLAPADAGPLALAPEHVLLDVDLELGAGGGIEGRVLVPQGWHPSSAVVAISRGDAFPRRAHLDEHGGYRFEGLAPGRWLVDVVPQGPDGKDVPRLPGFHAPERELPWTCVVEEGRTARADLPLAPVRIAGRLAFDGCASSGWSVRAVKASDSLLIPLDPWGRFELHARRPGEHALVLEGPTGSRIEHRIHLGSGSNPVAIDLECGALEGSVGPRYASGTGSVFFRWQRADGLVFVGRFSPEGAARYRHEPVPAGSVLVLAPGTGRPGPAPEVVVPAGGAATFDLP